MYESWFRLSKRPFNAPPQTADYFADQGIETAREALLRCIERNAGPGVVIGDHGTGKSLLSLILQRQCQSIRNVAHVSAPGIRNRKELLQTILFEFGLPYNLNDEGQLRLSLIDFLTSRDPSGGGAVLIIDDAHELSLDLLEQLASFSDLVRNGQWCVNLVLFGQQTLDDQLARPSLASLNQRIAARYYLRHWSYGTTRDYIRFQLQHAEASVDEIFDETAFDAVQETTDGVPRLINQVCDHAMILASIGGKNCICGQTIQEAWSDLQSLPTDMPTRPFANPNASDDHVVEFGSLDDEIDAPTAFSAASRPESRPTIATDDFDLGDTADGDEQGSYFQNQQVELTAEERTALEQGGFAYHNTEYQNFTYGELIPPEAYDRGDPLGAPSFGQDITTSVSAAQGFIDAAPQDGGSIEDLIGDPDAKSRPFEIEIGCFEQNETNQFLPDAEQKFEGTSGRGQDKHAIELYDHLFDEEMTDAASGAAGHEIDPHIERQLASQCDSSYDDGENSTGFGCERETELLTADQQCEHQPWGEPETDFNLSSDPDQMLDQIEQQIQAAEDQTPYNQTEPYCSRLPMGNPFMESFDEEEVVIGRSAGLDVEIVNRQPSVVTEQGGSLVDVLRLLENGIDEADQDYLGYFDHEDRVVASPEITAAVAAAVVARDQTEPYDSAPVDTTQITLAPSIAEALILQPSSEEPAPIAEDYVVGTAQPLYGDLHVTQGFSSGDQQSEVTGEPGSFDYYEEPRFSESDVIIAGFGDSSTEFVSPPGDVRPADKAHRVKFVSGELGASQSSRGEEEDLPPDRAAANEPANQAERPQQDRKPRRFGSLFSNLRDR